MEEQSQKDEMRAALQGDFERMRRRQVDGGFSVAAALPAPVQTEEQQEPVSFDAPRGSWRDRLRNCR